MTGKTISILGPTRVSDNRISYLAQNIGETIEGTLVTGAQPGAPEMVAAAHMAKGGRVIGYSALANMEEHAGFFKAHPSATEMHYMGTGNMGYDFLHRNGFLVTTSPAGVYFFEPQDGKFSNGAGHELLGALNVGMPVIVAGTTEGLRATEKLIGNFKTRTKADKIHLSDDVVEIVRLAQDYAKR